MKNVLIMGGTRFFGKRLVYRLLEEGHAVTIATRGITEDPFGNRVKRLKIDRENKETLFTAFEGQQWDIVYDQTCYSPLEVFEAAEALKGKVKRYIFTSTMAVYEFGTQHSEEDYQPSGFQFSFKDRSEYIGFEGYQEAKRAAETVLFKDQSFEVVAVRFPIVIGRDDYSERLKFHVEKVISGEPIGISDTDWRYSFITSEDAAEFLLGIGMSTFQGPINPGCLEDISLRKLLDKIEKVTKKKAVIENRVNKENASPYSLGGSWSINVSKAHSLGFQFADLNETLDDLLSFYSHVKV